MVFIFWLQLAALGFMVFGTILLADYIGKMVNTPAPIPKTIERDNGQ